MVGRERIRHLKYLGAICAPLIFWIFFFLMGVICVLMSNMYDYTRLLGVSLGIIDMIISGLFLIATVYVLKNEKNSYGDDVSDLI